MAGACRLRFSDAGRRLLRCSHIFLFCICRLLYEIPRGARHENVFLSLHLAHGGKCTHTSNFLLLIAESHPDMEIACVSSRALEGTPIRATMPEVRARVRVHSCTYSLHAPTRSHTHTPSHTHNHTPTHTMRAEVYQKTAGMSRQ